jgi:hypothetical protein
MKDAANLLNRFPVNCLERSDSDENVASRLLLRVRGMVS